MGSHEHLIAHVRSSCKATRVLQTQLRKDSQRGAERSGHSMLLKGLFEQLPIEERLAYRKLGNLFDENKVKPVQRRQQRSSTVKHERRVLDVTEPNIEEAKTARKVPRKSTFLPPKNPKGRVEARTPAELQSRLNETMKATQQNTQARRLSSPSALVNRGNDLFDKARGRPHSRHEPHKGRLDQLDTLSPINLTEERLNSGFPFTLFISGLKVANDATMLQKDHISAVLSLGKGNDPAHYSSIKYLHVAFELDSASLRPLFESAVRFISTHLRSGNVLVNCYHGQASSCAVVIAFLVTQLRFDLADAVARVVEARGTLEISGRLMRELEAFAVIAIG